VHNLQEVVRRVVRREVQPVQCTTFKEWSILAQQLRAKVQPLFLELEEEKIANPLQTPIFNEKKRSFPVLIFSQCGKPNGINRPHYWLMTLGSSLYWDGVK